jgi:hypothetical protein
MKQTDYIYKDYRIVFTDLGNYMILDEDLDHLSFPTYKDAESYIDSQEVS